jgi:fatty acid desaturase
MMSAETYCVKIGELRKAVLADDPGVDPRRKFPLQALVGVTWMALIAVLVVINLRYDLVWPLRLLISCVMGVLGMLLAFFNHGLMHGSIFKTKTMTRIFSYPGFFMFCISPELWFIWHNRVHHSYPNHPDGLDPDMAGNWSYLKTKRHGSFIVDLLPGGSVLSFLFLMFSFNALAAFVTWIHSCEKPELYRGVNRKIVLIETFTYYALWVAALVALGPKLGFFVLVLPVMLANWLTMNLAALPHGIRPMSPVNHPLATSLSLDAPGISNILLFGFCLHSEHHIFPEANQSYYPRVQAVLQRRFAKDYFLMPLFGALHLLHSTPRGRDANDQLFSPRTNRRYHLDRIREHTLEPDLTL